MPKPIADLPVWPVFVGSWCRESRHGHTPALRVPGRSVGHRRAPIRGFPGRFAIARRGAKQTAYQVLVASSPEHLAADQGDLWDSGKVVSDQSIHVAYAGKPLESRMQCYWKVRAWDKDGQPSAWSQPAQWSMGLLKPDDWQAKWIRVAESTRHAVAALATGVRRRQAGAPGRGLCLRAGVPRTSPQRAEGWRLRARARLDQLPQDRAFTAPTT